jgi:hypothetical protein
MSKGETMRRAGLSCSCGLAVLVLLTALGIFHEAAAAPRPARPVAPAVQQVSGGTIVVTSYADAGPGTLRQALLDAQSGDTIQFDPLVFPPDDPAVIAVLSTLPELAQGQVTIDASNAGVILDGSQLSREEHGAGLVIRSSGNIILGLQVFYFSGSGVAVLDAQNNQIGGAAAGEGNVISSNWDGVNLVGGGTMNTIVRGNYIGTDASGTVAMGNLEAGVWIGEGAQHNLIGGDTESERNLISGNRGNGLVIDGGTYNTVSGNYIGTDVTGTTALGNGSGGVSLAWSAQYNLIGGDAPEERNVISGNHLEGVSIGTGHTMHNMVSGNYIGTNAAGTAALPNGNSGVILTNGAQENLIGGTTEAERNLVSGNGGDGVTIAGSGVMNNVVQGNYIGTDADGNAPLGNDKCGVAIDGGAGPNTLGPGNLIAYNGLSGVRVHGPHTLGNTITANTIYENGELGIEMGEGGNAGVSPPIITSVGTRFISGTAPPNSTVEVFGDEFEEGKVFEGSTMASGEGTFTFQLPAGRFAGPHVITTATDTGGNTSSFSSPASPPTPAVTQELPGIVAPTQVSTDPKVVGTNLGLALFCVLFFGLTSTVFNSILEEYRSEIVGALGRLVPRPLADGRAAIDRSLGHLAGKGRGGLVFTWLMVLLATSLIESFLDPGIGILALQRLGLWVTLFISAVIVSGLELGSELYAHRRWAPATRTEYRIQWIGLALAIACVILSRCLRFAPGYLYGIVGAIYLTPKLTELSHSAKRAIVVLSAVFAGSFLLWIASAFLPAALAELEPILLTIFLIGLQGVFFQMFPLAVTDGGDIWSWKKGIWFLFFVAVFFGFYHFVLNPNASDVQALQQNGVQTLLLLIAVFGLATFVLWLLLPFRLERRRAKRS